MKKIKLGSVKDGQLFKRSNTERAIWMKKIKSDVRTRMVIYTSTQSEKSFRDYGRRFVFVKSK